MTLVLQMIISKMPHKKLGYELVTITEAGWWNMGLYSWDFIEKNKHYFLSLKDCTKSQAILSERFNNRLTENLSYYVEESGIIEKNLLIFTMIQY